MSPEPPTPGSLLDAIQRIAVLVNREGTSLESIVDRVAYLAENAARGDGAPQGRNVVGACGATPRDERGPVCCGGSARLRCERGHVMSVGREEYNELRLRGQPPGGARHYDVTVRSDAVDPDPRHGTRWDQLVNVARLALGLREGWTGWSDVTVERRHVATTRTETPWQPVPTEDLERAAAGR